MKKANKDAAVKMLEKDIQTSTTNTQKMFLFVFSSYVITYLTMFLVQVKPLTVQR